MPLEPEAVACRHLALEDLDGLELELHHLPAAAADDVVVVDAPERGFVVPCITSNDSRLYDTGLGEEREGPIDGGLGAANPAAPEIGDQVLDGEVPPALERRLDDGRARGGEAEGLLREEPPEAQERLAGTAGAPFLLNATKSHYGKDTHPGARLSTADFG